MDTGIEFSAMSGSVVEPLVNGAEQLKGSSLSGNERDHLFLSNFASERQFTEVSGISGLDHPADGRAFAYLDYDHDGYQDLVVVSANAPWVTFYRNRMGDLASRGKGERGGFVALRLVGGNRTAASSDTWSNRDGYGAVVTAELAEGLTLMREHRAGEGFSAQNSATVTIGIGAHPQVERLRVTWPSGVVQELPGVPAGSLVTVYEDPSSSPSGEAFVRRGYPLPTPRPSAGASIADRLELPYMRDRAGSAKLNMYSMMATWCAACRAEQPDLEALRAEFGDDELAMYGLPADVEEDAALLADYADRSKPVYELLADLPKDQVTGVVDYMAERLGSDALPQTVITDASGRVLLARYGAPYVSEVRRLLNALEDAPVETLGGSR